MITLFEVLYREGEEELKKFILATDEADVQARIAEQELEGAAYFAVAETDEIDVTAVQGPTQLTKNTDGIWEETA